MAPKQRMRVANEKHSQNVTNRGNVPKTMVSFFCTTLLKFQFCSPSFNCSVSVMPICLSKANEYILNK